MKSGKLTHVLTIQRATHGINPAGTPTTVWADLATLRAEKVEQSTTEFIRNYGAADETVAVFRTRFLAGVTNADPFVEMDVYDEGAKPVDLDRLKGEPCWLAVDLSSTTDLSVIVACWRTAEGYVVHPWFFCPEERVERQDDGSFASEDGVAAREGASGVSYRAWAEEGFIAPTEGNVIDYAAVAAKIVELHEDFDVREIAFDPALAQQVKQKCQEMGLPVVDFRQGALTMMPAIMELERAILGGEFRHGGHPVLRHCFANVVVKRNDLGHITRLTKPKQWLSIDGAVAAAMAVARAAAGEQPLFTSADLFTTDFFRG